MPSQKLRHVQKSAPGLQVNQINSGRSLVYNNISDLGLCYTILDGGNTDRNTNRGLAPAESLIKVRTKLSYTEQMYTWPHSAVGSELDY